MPALSAWSASRGVRALVFVLPAVVYLSCSTPSRRCDDALWEPLRLAVAQGERRNAIRLSGCLAEPARTAAALSALQVNGALAELERRASAAAAQPRDELDYAEALVAAGQAATAIGFLESRGPLDDERRQRLGAAYQARGLALGHARDLVEALDLLATVLRRDPINAVVQFNYALALERFSLRHRAILAWTQYLKIDPSTSWSVIARQRLADLQRAPPYSRWAQASQTLESAADAADTTTLDRLVGEFPQAARELVDDRLLPAWADRIHSGDSGAPVLLARASAIADSVSRLNGDRLSADEIARLKRDSAGDRADPALIDAYQSFRRGRDAFEADRELDAASELDKAQRLLRARDHPLWLWAAVHAAHASFNRYRGDELMPAVAQLQSLAEIARHRQYSSVEGRARYVIASMLGAKTRLSDAVSANQQSAAIFRRTRQSAYLAATEVILASELQLLGEADDSWTAVAEALANVGHVTSARRRYAVVINAALGAIAEKRFRVALDLIDEALAVAQEEQTPNRLAEGHLHRARTLVKLGEVSGPDLGLAAVQIERVADFSLQRRLRAEWMIARAETEAEPGDAVTRLTESLAYFEDKSFLSRVASIRLARGRANLRGGDDRAAETDFEAGIRAYEEYRGALTREQQRVTSAEAASDLFDEMIRFQLDTRHSPPGALAVVEQARARTLLESFTHNRAIAPEAPSTMRSQLPRTVRIVYYALLDDRLLTWVLSRDGEQFIDRRVDLRALAALAAAQIEQLESGRPLPPGSPSERLFSVLVEPVRQWLPAGSTMVIVPDGFLNRVAFAALRSPGTKRFLIEDYPLVTAPSAAMFVAASRRLQQRTETPRTAYVAGDPRDTLPDAALEAREVAALYPDARVETGARATKRSFLANAGRYDIVHFAGHARSAANLPLLAYLEFAPDAGEGPVDVMFADEIGAMNLAQTRLVVLAACRTAQGQTRRGEGILSLARPVLGAGAPSVIGTLWDVQDAHTRALLVAFHKRVARGQAAGEALRDTQLAALRGDAATAKDPTMTWAAFVAIGGIR
jgi:CHAT domain-containing protein